MACDSSAEGLNFARPKPDSFALNNKETFSKSIQIQKDKETIFLSDECKKARDLAAPIKIFTLISQERGLTTERPPEKFRSIQIEDGQMAEN
ncbi:hypothetical protein Leryth_001859 [Lithospermum erythrorhizon]|nr:hypothetical protein Leryth_001859 [Lithospermum erythrorhizon]